ncbi:diguanylate cyclase (GGDEF) domain-containing protein [Desulfosporosinus orientis DSM 765]|uniref:Diguanylate cyclase (GGDEF) domain-containing protein n=1 Tax=Desulfosporosinus orientis (strain ATCC 19365 / DSM 765 / NCIMB 8382 / VKM B-1628 / Singapore I) TaxID=768706 RepID=G7WDD0_DESOD|nr:GGDEF domain-containing protein [Desulfosporosinus orientis]AET67899.1 diguanylate cyclase (GGDEF) domain-containing protein [Desulfosporosinus orientis DSM 765]
MNSNFDLKTMFMVLALGNFCTIILMIAYNNFQGKNNSTKYYIAGKFLLMIAWVLFAMRGVASDLISIIIANSLLFVGVSLNAIAFILLKGFLIRSVKQLYLVFIVISILIFNIVSFLGNENIRVAVGFIIPALIIIPIYVSFLTDKKASRLQILIAVIHMLASVPLFLRAYVSLSSPYVIQLYTPNVFTTWSFLSLFVSLIIGSTGFVLLAKQQDDEELIKFARFDFLTNIYNRRTFFLFAQKSIALCVRKTMPVSLILIDIDNFKKVNDLYGHHIGDEVLKDFASETQRILRQNDLLCRYGGEEFTILLPGADEEDSNKVATRLREVIGQRGIPNHPELKYTVSMGAVSVIPDYETDLEILLKQADVALYTAKNNGKNRIERYSKMA